jgi:hypothetical protein
MEIPQWNMHNDPLPLNVEKAWQIAFKNISKAVHDEEIMLHDIEFLNLQFAKGAGFLGGITRDRWFYLVTARPKGYQTGKSLQNEQLYTVVVLTTGRVLAPTVSILPSDVKIERLP